MTESIVVISRRVGQVVCIEGGIEIELRKSVHGSATLVIHKPTTTEVYRKEVRDRLTAINLEKRA